MCQLHSVLVIKTWTVALPCRVPKGLEWTTPWGSLLQLEGCFQTQQDITASLSFGKMWNGACCKSFNCMI